MTDIVDYPVLARADVPDSVEIQTDKDIVKIVPCTGDGCQTRIGANRFYAPAKAKCAACGHGGTRERTREPGSLAVVQAGRTAPEKASNLADCLLNHEFAAASCPISPDHRMELIAVNHNERYGPSKLVGVDAKGTPRYDNSTGETVTHQCRDCRTVVTYSTVHQMQYRRQNEPRRADPNAAPALQWLLGPRGERETAA